MATINIKPGMKILDLGCGSGYLTFPMAEMNENAYVIGLDIVTDTLERNTQNFVLLNAWKRNNEGVYELQKIDWVNEMLPYGMLWHYDRFRNTIINGGRAFGCFDGKQLVGFATVDAKIFEKK